MGLYLNRNQQQVGPYEIEQVNQMLASNQIDIKTLGWHDGMGNWEPLSSPTFSSFGISLPKQSIASSTQNQGMQSRTNRQMVGLNSSKAEGVILLLVLRSVKHLPSSN